MARYRIFETAGFQDDLARLTRSGLGRLREKLQASIYPRLRTEGQMGALRAVTFDLLHATSASQDSGGAESIASLRQLPATLLG